MYHAGDRIKSSPYFASQFPRPIQCNGGKPMTGVVRRVRDDGQIVVHWDGRVSEVTLHPDFVLPEKSN